MIQVSNLFMDINRYGDKKEYVHRGSFIMEEDSIGQKKLSEQNLKQVVGWKQKAVSEQNQEAVEEQEKADDKKTETEASKTDTDIIVKPDGSRVLLVTTKVCGMQTSMSLEISGPTAMPNDSSKDADGLKDRGIMRKASVAYESGYMTGIETESGFE